MENKKASYDCCSWTALDAGICKMESSPSEKACFKMGAGGGIIMTTAWKLLRFWLLECFCQCECHCFWRKQFERDVIRVSLKLSLNKHKVNLISWARVSDSNPFIHWTSNPPLPSPLLMDIGSESPPCPRPNMTQRGWKQKWSRQAYSFSPCHLWAGEAFPMFRGGFENIWECLVAVVLSSFRMMGTALIRDSCTVLQCPAPIRHPNCP